MPGFPSVRQKFTDAACRVGRQASEHVAHVPPGFEFVRLGRGDKTEKHGGRAAAPVVAGKQPVLAADRNRSYRPFRPVVVDGQAAVLDVPVQRRPIGPRVFDGLADGALRQHVLSLALQPFPDLPENRRRLLLP